jgi:hypothetical protein
MTQATAARAVEDEAGTLSRALVVWDRLDNELIEAQLSGRSVTTWAYAFRQEGKELRGLSVEGIEECSRLAAMRGEALRVIDWKLEDQGEAYFAIVQCGRYAVKGDTGEAILLDTSIGTKREKKVKVRRTGGFYTDDNAADIAMSKATRNAKSKLLDPQLKEQVLDSAIESGRVVTPTKQEAEKVVHAERREAIPPPQTKVEEDECRRRFYAVAKERCSSQAEIHKAAGVKCPPEKQHDIDPKDPRYCNALRDGVNSYAQLNKTTKGAAWEYFRAALLDQTEEAEPEEPYTAEDLERDLAEESP